MADDDKDDLMHFFIILSIIFSSMGTNFIFSDFEKKFRKNFNNPFLKITIIFSVFYLYTKNIRNSLLGAFVIFILYHAIQKEEETCKRLDLKK